MQPTTYGKICIEFNVGNIDIELYSINYYENTKMFIDNCVNNVYKNNICYYNNEYNLIKFGKHSFNQLDEIKNEIAINTNKDICSDNFVNNSNLDLISKHKGLVAFDFDSKNKLTNNQIIINTISSDNLSRYNKNIIGIITGTSFKQTIINKLHKQLNKNNSNQLEYLNKLCNLKLDDFNNNSIYVKNTFILINPFISKQNKSQNFNKQLNIVSNEDENSEDNVDNSNLIKRKKNIKEHNIKQNKEEINNILKLEEDKINIINADINSYKEKLKTNDTSNIVNNINKSKNKELNLSIDINDDINIINNSKITVFNDKKVTKPIINTNNNIKIDFINNKKSENSLLSRKKKFIEFTNNHNKNKKICYNDILNKLYGNINDIHCEDESKTNLKANEAISKNKWCNNKLLFDVDSNTAYKNNEYINNNSIDN